MSKFENTLGQIEIPNRRIKIEHHVVEGKEIIVSWNSTINDLKRTENSFVGKIEGVGNDGSKWEGEGIIFAVAVDNKIKGFGIDKILSSKIIKKPEPVSKQDHNNIQVEERKKEDEEKISEIRNSILKTEN